MPVTGDADLPPTLPGLSLPLHTVGLKVGSQVPPPASALRSSAHVLALAPWHMERGTRLQSAGVQTLSQTRPDAAECTTACRDPDRCANVRKLAHETDKPELLSDPGHGHLLSSTPPAVLPSLESWWHPSPDPAVQGHTRSRGMPSGDHACGPHSAASWGLHGAQGPLPPFPLPSQPPLLLEPPLPHSSPYFWSPTPKPDPSTLPNAAPH